MCKVSVIVPVYNVERYLRTCMDSLISQTLEDIEILAVNDGSPDNSLSILEEYESRYPAKIKVYTIENHGVSYARNYGADRAKGEYLLFVDSDDYVEPGLCQELYEKAVRDGNDFVMCNRNDLYLQPNGEETAKAINITTANQNFTIEQYPYELVWLSPFPWDKLIKKELFMKVRFPEQIRFEDLAFVLKIACIAQSIGVVRTPLYNYRRTGGGFLNSFSEATLDIIKAFDNVLCFMRENGFLEKYREELSYICARHFFFRYPALLDKNNHEWKLKKEMVCQTQEFLDENFSGWRENHYLKYSSAPTIKNRLGLYCSRKKMLRVLRMERILPEKLWNFGLKLSNRVKRFAKGFKNAKSKSKWLAKKFKILRIMKMPAAYAYTKAFLKYPVEKKLVLFESKHGEDIAGNIFNMIRQFQSDEFRSYSVHLVLNDATEKKWEELAEKYGMERVKVVKLRSREYYQCLASAGYLITDTSFPVYFIKKPEQVYLNTWHGTPLKGMGRQVPGREYGLGNIQRNFLIADWLLFQNEFSRDVFLDDYMIRSLYPGKVMLTGYPRNSALYQKKLGEEIRRENYLDGKQLIAYMPTWRGMLHKKDFGKQVKDIYQYLAKIDEQLEASQVFFVKLHPFVGDAIEFDSFKHIRPFLPQYDTYDFLTATDMLVTDYSSIMFDYAVSGKKIILFTYDREAYLKDRGMYIDLEDLEFPVADTVEQLVEEIKRPNQGYPQFQDTYCKYDSEEAAMEVCRTMISGEDSVKTEVFGAQANCPNVLIYVEGIKNPMKFQKIIQEVNELDLDKYHYFLAFRAGAASFHTELLQQLDKRVGYIPLQKGLNALLREYLAKWMYQKLGADGIWVEKQMTKLCMREAAKHYGQSEFSRIIYYSGASSMNMKILSGMSGTKICNLTEYSQKMFHEKASYRRFIKTVTNSKMNFNIFYINEEFAESEIYQKTKDKHTYRIEKTGENGIHNLMEEQP